MSVDSYIEGEGEEPVMHWIVAFYTYLSYALIILTGHIRDFIGSLTGTSRYRDTTMKKGYAPIFKSWESFYTRRLYHRIQDCWNRPICSAPGTNIKVMERITKDGGCTYQTSGKSIDAINLGSYNYLGFGDDWKISCRDEVMEAVDHWPVSFCSSRMDIGSNKYHEDLENIVARFLNKEAAVVFAMGYGTNASVIPALCGPESLIISDALNHASLVNGARASGASIRVFRHNEAEHLDEVLREAIVKGQPKHHRPWKKILVVVEGIYSMEGDICKLKEINAVCKKYKAYLYVDEAHSIGALGATGRGICEKTGVDPKDIDILMGTFTKSFAGMGGYIAASKEIIQHLKTHVSGILYHNSMCPVITKQVVTAFKVIMGEDGTDIGKQKIDSLRENSNYFRREMHRLGLQVLGHSDSPIVPVMLYIPSKIAAFSRECLKRGLAVVVVGFPACPVILSRTRFCISAGTTKEEIEKAVKIIDEVADVLCLKYNNY